MRLISSANNMMQDVLASSYSSQSTIRMLPRKEHLEVGYFKITVSRCTYLLQLGLTDDTDLAIHAEPV